MRDRRVRMLSGEMDKHLLEVVGGRAKADLVRGAVYVDRHVHGRAPRMAEFLGHLPPWQPHEAPHRDIVANWQVCPARTTVKGGNAKFRGNLAIIAEWRLSRGGF